LSQGPENAKFGAGSGKGEGREPFFPGGRKGSEGLGLARGSTSQVDNEGLICASCGAGAGRDGLCTSCRCAKLAPHNRKYTFTPQILEELQRAYIGKRPEVTAKLRLLSARFRIPLWKLKQEANRRDWRCCPRRRFWSAEENDILRERAGSQSVECIAKLLGRTREAVENQVRKLRVSLRITAGYTLSDLAEVFGTNTDRVRRWAERGLLGKAHTRGSASRFTEANVMRFIRSYPHEYSLARVDQAWFTSMVFGHLASKGAL
jgi:hypothetical protein